MANDILGDGWWSAVGECGASLSEEDQQSLRCSAESLYEEMAARWSDKWSDEAVQFMERCLVRHSMASPSTLTDESKRQFSLYIGTALAERSGGYFVRLPVQLRDSGDLAVFFPGDNALVPLAGLVDEAIVKGSADVWLRELKFLSMPR